MWKCVYCGKEMDDEANECSGCSRPRVAKAPSFEGKWVMCYQSFRGTLTTWQNLFDQAADFATKVGRDRVVTISHSEDQNDGIVTVWYWDR